MKNVNLPTSCFQTSATMTPSTKHILHYDRVCGGLCVYLKQKLYDTVHTVIMWNVFRYISFNSTSFLFYSHVGPVTGSWLAFQKSQWIGSVHASKCNEIKRSGKIYTWRWNQEIAPVRTHIHTNTGQLTHVEGEGPPPSIQECSWWLSCHLPGVLYPSHEVWSLEHFSGTASNVLPTPTGPSSTWHGGNQSGRPLPSFCSSLHPIFPSAGCILPGITYKVLRSKDLQERLFPTTCFFLSVKKKSPLRPLHKQKSIQCL